MPGFTDVVPVVPNREEGGKHIHLSRLAEGWRDAQDDGVSESFTSGLGAAMHVSEGQGLNDFLFTADLMDRELIRGASNNTLQTTYNILGYRTDCTTFDPKSLKDIYGTMHADSDIPENAPYPQWAATDVASSLQVTKRGWQWDLSMEAWLRDNKDFGMLAKQPYRWGRCALYTKEYMFTATFAAKASYFSTGNGNLADGSSTPWYLFRDPEDYPGVIFGQIKDWPDYDILMRAADAQALVGGGDDLFGFSNDSIGFKFRFTFGTALGHTAAIYRSELELNHTNLDAAIQAHRALPDAAGNANSYLGKLYLVVPPSLTSTANNLVSSQVVALAGTGASVTIMGNKNTLQSSCTVVTNHLLPLVDSVTLS